MKPVKFGYTIVYVSDVLASLTFFEAAFGFPQKFLYEGGTYGELDTGEITLAFASHELGQMNLPDGYIKADRSDQLLGFEIALVTETVDAAHQKAIATGATEISPPTQKPWGQTVSYVRSPDGILIELCSPIQQ